MKKLFKDLAVGEMFLSGGSAYVKAHGDLATLFGEDGYYGFGMNEEVTVVTPEVKTRMTHIAMPIISDKIIKHIADLGWIQREDGKIVHKLDMHFDTATTYENMEDLIMSALSTHRTEV